MRLMVCAGGSGGGVYPALSILRAAQEKSLVNDVMWVGGEGGMEVELIDREKIPFRAIPAAGVHSVELRSLPGNLLRLGRGVFAARKVIADFKPDVVLFTGGYVAGPVAFAARHIPVLLYVPDIEPGMALKFLARFSDRICLIAEDSKQFFQGRGDLIVTGHPTRKGLHGWEREAACRRFGLDPAQPVLLVFGGSKGARSINQAVLAVIDDLLKHLQVLHITGELDWPDIREQVQSIDPALAGKYHATPYLHEEMGAAYAAADMVLSRAGASSIGEFPLYGIPAILVPYPNAWRYQKVNADFLVKQGAGIELPDEQMKDRLLDTILGLWQQPDRRSRMQMAMRRVGFPDAAGKIADELKVLARHPAGRTEGSRL